MLALRNLGEFRSSNPCWASVDDSREAYTHLTTSCDHAFKWMEGHPANRVYMFAPEKTQWEAIADGLRKWSNNGGIRRHFLLGYFTLG